MSMDENYVSIMEAGLNNKTALLQFINWEYPVIDVGSSTGALTFELADLAATYNQKVYTLEPDKDTYERLIENTSTFKNVIAIQKELHPVLRDITDHHKTPLNIVLSSVIHHMYKYRQEAFDGLSKLASKPVSGSRIIIRDGVRPSNNRADEIIGLQCVPSSLVLAKEFLRRFQEWHEPFEYEINGRTIWAAKWLIIEMILTITWGKSSMERECYEHYTLLAVEEYISIFKQTGYDIIYAEAITQAGYYMFLPKLGKLINRKGYEIPIPFTNQIVVVEKQ